MSVESLRSGHPRRGIADEPEVIWANRREVPHQRGRNGDRHPDTVAIVQEQALDLALPTACRVHHDPAFVRREHADTAVVLRPGA